MYQIKANPSKNALYITLKGFLNDDEVKDAVSKIMKGADQLKPGFTVINDISEFSPTSPNAMKEIQKVQLYVKQKGVKKTIRIVGNVLSKSQLKRTQQEANAGYEVIEVRSLAEAEKHL